MTIRAANASRRWTASERIKARGLAGGRSHRVLHAVSSAAATELALGGERHDPLLVGLAPDSSPVIRPSHMTMMRWLMRRISGSSEEIMMIDLPSAPAR